MRVDPLTQPFRECHGSIENRSGKQKKKLFTAVSSDAIDLPGLFL